MHLLSALDPFNIMMFANNYLYVLNHHMCFDVIPIVNTIINLTRRFRAPHKDRWVTLMIWEEICWLHMLRGEVYAEEVTRLTTAGHQQCYIKPRRQLALETGMAWTHGRPVVHTTSITDSLDRICGLTYSANQHSTTDGWNMLTLRLEIQSPVRSSFYCLFRKDRDQTGLRVSRISKRPEPDRLRPQDRSFSKKKTGLRPV